MVDAEIQARDLEAHLRSRASLSEIDALRAQNAFLIITIAERSQTRNGGVVWEKAHNELVRLAAGHKDTTSDDRS